MALGLLIAWLIHRAVVWCRAWWYRWLGRRGEASAASLLKAAGYTVIDAQLRLPCSYLVDGEAVPYAVRVDFVVEKGGRRYVADALDERTRAIRDLADATRPNLGPVPLVAPMPGLIVRVHVAVGDVVRAGQPLIAIEAMKMENELVAPAAGTVRAIHAVPGSPVEKGATLVEFA